MNKIYNLTFNLLLLVCLFKTSAQVDINYNIKADLNLIDESIIISQTIRYKNVRTKNTNELFLYDKALVKNLE